MDIETLKNRKKQLKLTFEALSEETGLPIGTLKSIFSFRTPTPRIDTMEKICNALLLNDNTPFEQRVYKDVSIYKQILKQRKMTYEQLSTMSGVPKQTISKIFSGQTQNPRTDTIALIEETLGITRTTKVESHENKIKLYSEIPSLSEYECKSVLHYIEFLRSVKE